MLFRSHNSYLVVQSPGLLYSYLLHEKNKTEGYIIYFKPEFLSFLKLNLEQEFPFFNFMHTSLFTLLDKDYSMLETYFKDVLYASKQKNESAPKVTCLKLLSLFYAIKEYSQTIRNQNEQPLVKGDAILQKFLSLVNEHYLEKRTVKEYATLLSVSPNHLSQLIKKQTDRNALSFINEKIATEAHSFVLHTDYNISEIAQRLNFTDTSNFIKFFKSHIGKTPKECRKKSDKEVLVY